MSVVNTTNPYNLPLFQGSDLVDMMDLTMPMQTINDALVDNKNETIIAGGKADSAQALATSANAMATSAMENVLELDEQVNNWELFNLSNPNQSLFESYSGSVHLNKKIGMASLYLTFTVKSGQTNNLTWDSNSGTTIITLPEVFNNTHQSSLYMSGLYNTSDGTNTYTAFPRLVKNGRNIVLASKGYPRYSNETITLFTFSEVYVIKNWL